MSIHSDGGGVDVGTWNESNDFSCQESIPFPDSDGLGGDREAPAMSMAKQPITNHLPGPQISVTMERGTLSESNIHNMGSEPVQNSSLASASTIEIHRPQLPKLSTQMPSQCSLPHSVPRRPARQSSTSMNSGMSRTVPQPHPQSTALPVSALGTGFQIGLSPLSPGFTIVPLDRRRRMSGRPSLADVANDTIIGLRAERQAVNDGGLTRTFSNEVRDVSRDNGAVREDHMERSDVGGIDENERRGRLEARRRWNWIRTVLTGKD